MGKDKWERSAKPIGWTDIETMMRAIGTYHSACVSVIISPLGTGASGGVVTDVTATFNVLPGSSLPSLVGAKGRWPCGEHDQLEAHIFALLYDLDGEIGRTYEQASFLT